VYAGIVRLSWPLLVLALCACADDETSSVVPPSSCGELELALEDGSCIRPGIPSDACAPGFVHDGAYGCEPVLAPPCGPGLMAVPGEETCRPIMACGTTNWGDIPVDGNTVYVDAAFSGTENGSAAAPWTTIAEAVNAAPSGALVAIAAGSYVENVVVAGKPLRLWGVCPERVEIVGSSLAGGGCPPAALCVTTGASGSEVHGVALRGTSVAYTQSGAENVLLDRLWIHEAGDRGIDLESAAGPTSARVQGSLIEQCRDMGVYARGSDVTIEATVVRGTQPDPDLFFGYGIGVEVPCQATDCEPGSHASAVVRGSVVEANHEVGIHFEGADGSVEASVVRGNLPGADGQHFGRGINIQLVCSGDFCNAAERSNVEVRTSVIDQNHDTGLLVGGSDALIEDTVVRGTQPEAADQTGGRGVDVQLACPAGVCDPATRSVATLRRSLIQDNRDVAVYVGGSEVTIEDIVVRATSPRASDQRFGRGVGAELACDQNGNCDASAVADVTLRRSLVEQSYGVGVFMRGGSMTVEATTVRQTLAQLFDGIDGDGIAAAHDDAPTVLSLADVHVEDSARAGVASFGADILLRATRIACATFELDGEEIYGRAYSFEDQGGNNCGCPMADADCAVVSSGLVPPAPLPAPGAE